MNRMRHLVSLLFLFFSLAVAGQAPILVKNINTNTTDVLSHADPLLSNNGIYPLSSISANGKLIFPARNYNGTELWRTDGTTNGTSLIRDINSFSSFGDANPQMLTQIGNYIYFFSADFNYLTGNYNNFILHRYNTVTDDVDVDFSRQGFDYVSEMIAANGKLFFVAYTDNSSDHYNPYQISDTSLMMYDPNSTGIEKKNENRPKGLCQYGDYLVFSGTDNFDGRELWTYNIPNDYSEQRENINQFGTDGSNPHDFIVYNDVLYLTADEGNGEGMQLRYSDFNTGVSGTISFGQTDFNPRNKIVFNNQLYFRGYDASSGNSGVYSYFNNSYSINLIQQDFNSTNGSMITTSNYLFFAADDGNSGNELWQTDGSNTNLSVEANTYGDGNPYNLTVMNDQVFFSATNESDRYVPFVTDGSSGGLIQNIGNNGAVDPIHFLSANNGAVYFYANDDLHGAELWKTDGTAANTILVKDINLGDNASIGSDISGLDSLNGNVYFGARNGDNYGLYKSDGTQAGTVLVADGNTAGFNSMYYSPDHIKIAGNTIFFDANNYNTTGYELWKSDGTQAGTQLVKDINPGTGSSSPNNMTALNGFLIFTADDGINGRELWKSDGTSGGTFMLKDIRPGGIDDAGIRSLVVQGDSLYFVANDGTNGEELWVTDGTAAGTVMLKDINPGSAGANPQGMKIINGKLYFQATNPTFGAEPWISDGTPAGTHILKDIIAGTGSSKASDFAGLGSYVYFSADSTSGDNHSLWRTNGTDTGTHFFHPVGYPFLLTNMGNKIGFICSPFNISPTAHGFEMWATDGTYSGTQKLTDFGAYGVPYFFLTDFPAYKNHWFVYLDDNDHSLELWQTDGTPTGTFLNDIAPGRPGSYPGNLKPAGNQMFFTANDGSINGYELWKINVSTSVTWLSFTATRQDSTHALLQWSTANEVNNHGFVLEHSSNNVSFDSAGFIPAGAPTGATYSFVDTLKSGNNYYRLRQIDNAGNISYSNTEYLFKPTPLYAGLIKKSDTLCFGQVPMQIRDSIPASGGNGTYTFQWQDSTATRGWANISGATGITFSFTTALNQTRFYRRQVKDGTDSLYTNVVVKMYPVVPDTTLAADTAWRGYLYSGNDINLSPANTQYLGYYTDTSSHVNTANQWTPLGSPSLAANYIGCPSGGDNFTLALKRKGFTPGNYVMNLIRHDDGVRVLVNGNTFFEQLFGNYGAVPTVSLGALTPSDIVEVRLGEISGGALVEFSFYQSELRPGQVRYDQTICNGAIPQTLQTDTSAYGGPRPLQITYQWQDSTAAGSWQNISGANALTYAPPALTTTHYYRRAAGDGQSAVVYSNIVTITVLPPVSETPVVTKTGRTLSVNPVPNVQSYKWFRNGSLISGATNNTYTALLAGTYTAKYTLPCGDGPVSNAITFATDALSQTINFTAPANITFSSNAYIRLQASASSGLPVRYRVVNGNATISGDTVYVFNTGTITIEASQPGNDTYAPAQTVNQSFTVAAGSQAISFAAIPNKKLGDPAFDVSATSSAGLPVSYSISSGPASVSGNQITLTGVGIVTVKASQSGNGNYNAATDAYQSFCVGVASLDAITGATNVCPVAFKYATQKIVGATYEWTLSGGGTLTQNADSATVQWQTPGTYTLSVKAYSSCDAVRNTASTLLITVQNVVIPGPVNNMLPADGAMGQQLPLTLSWIPDSNNVSYDLYVWDSTTTQPATPYAAGITAVSFTLPQNSFAYNKAYKWRIVSYSGCSQISGPVQSFRLIPLPDLLVSNIQVPATAFSGQPIAINWQIKNIGPGRTTLNQRWNDAVFLSFDSTPNFNITPNTNPAAWSQLDFPIRPLLLGTVPNVSALDSGQVYNSSLSFTLPANYSWPLYVYVITNYAPGSTAPLEATLVNDTAHAPSPIDVTLSPAPDLRVDSLVTPATTFSGSTINVRYQVRNYGATTLLGNGWTDKVYLSLNPFFDVNNSILLKAPKANGTYYFNAPDALFGNAQQLQHDSLYTKSVQVVIPNFISGTYFIYVLTDANNAVYEGTTENNNSAASQVQVFLTPTPLLTVSSLALPGNALSTTQPVGVNWNITNTGSVDNIEKNKGHYVRVLQYCNTCYQSPCYIAYDVNGNPYSVCPTAPGYRVADSLGYGSSHWTDKVYLSLDSTSLDVNNALLLGNYIHGNYNPPDYDYSGNIPFYQYIGSGVPSIINPTGLNVNTDVVLKNGSTHPGTYNFSVPSNLPQGTYYLYVLANADDAVYEYPNQVQTRRSNALVINRPDLIVPTITTPATANSGQAITINYSVQNSGPGSVFNQARTDYVYISNSGVFDASAVLIASPTFTESVPANAQVQHQFNYTIPASVSGIRYFYVFTNRDSTFKENNYANNINSTQASINVSLTPPPNLSVSNITVPASIFSVTNFSFKYTVPNNGTTTTTGNWIDSIFISCTSNFDASTAYYVGRRLHNNAVAPGSSYTDSFALQIPFTTSINSCFGTATNTTGYFFVKTNADGGLYESSSADNVTGTAAISITNPLPDLIVSSVTGSTSAIVGRNYPISWTDKNIGLNPGTAYFSSWYDAFFFSTDTVWDASDVYAGNYGINTPLNNNQSVANTTSSAITTPNIPAGDYYVLVRANHYNSITSGEVTFNNNVNTLRNGSGAPQKVTVTAPLLPDLADTILTAPTSVATGQPLTISYRVSNGGPGVTYPSTWNDGVWLSEDFVPGNANDIYLGAFNHSGALQPAESYTDTLTLPIGLTVPQGNYVLIIKTNSNNNIFETSTNNNLAFRYITVYRPAPSDLIVSSINQADTVLLGYADTTTWVLQNTSTNIANGIETDGIYLSKNNVLDSTATLLGIKQNTLSLAPLATDTLTAAPLLQGVTEGLYNVLVKTDILNNIVETNKNNNTGIAAKQLYVKVKELPLSILTPDQLPTNGSRYYKLVIPDSLNDATILLTLKSADSLAANNRLYVGLGYIPSAARFDYAFGTPNSGNQQILMPSVLDSVYYITVNNANNRPAQNITLLAQRLPFAIVSANTNRGGNSGNVTTKLTGSLFTNNMAATLQRGSTIITATAIYYVNTTTVYATFPLQGVALGQYDVVLTKPNATITTLANGFNVVAPDNGGLITGGGVNTGQTGSGGTPGCAPGTPSGLNSQLSTQIVIPPKVFAGWPFTIQIQYSNPTNVDIPIQTRTLYSLDGLPLSLNQSTVDAGTSSLYIEFGGQGGPPNIIPAGTSGVINVYSKPPANYPGHKLANYILR